MMHQRKIVGALMAAALASTAAFAQTASDGRTLTYDQTKLAQAGMKFLEIGLSARAEGMGGAVTGLNMGASSIFYNPAGLANPIGNMGDVFVARTNWVADVAVNAFAASYKTPYAVVGVSFMSIDYGTVEGYKLLPDLKFQSTGNVDVGTSAFGIGLARQVTDKFQIGLTARYVSEDLGVTAANGSGDGGKTTALVFDAGTLYQTGLAGSVLSMSIRNFSRQAKHQDEGYDLPLIFRIGLSMDVLNMQQATRGANSLLVNLDALHPRDRAEEALVGLEYGFQNMVFARAATRIGKDYTGSDLARPTTISVASLGAGIRYQIGPTDLQFNYSWSDQGSLLGAVNRFDIQVGF